MMGRMAATEVSTEVRTSSMRRTKPRLARGDWRSFFFVAPFLAVYGLLLVYPLFYGMWISAHSYDMFDQAAIFVGWANYTRLLSDSIFLGAVRNTALFALMTVPAFLVIGLALALALNRPGRGAALLRAIFFGTSILSVTIVTIVWKVIFIPGQGLLGVLSETLGLPRVAMLTDPDLALVAIVITTIWWGIGLPMILFLAALQQIPREIYEAAALDNASRWGVFRHITLPSIRRTTIVVVVYEIVLQFQLFGQAQLLTQGGPNNATRSIVLFIYEQGFRAWDLGYAAAASEILFLIITVVAFLQYFLLTRSRQA